MDWRVKAIIQKILSTSSLGDRLNHSPITFSANYHQNVTRYQSWECLRRFTSTPLEIDEDSTVLEIGTGYSLISAVVLSLLGFKKVITVDITNDISFKTFKQQIQYLDNEIANEICQRSKFSKQKIIDIITKIKSQPNLFSVFQILNIKYIAPYRFDDIDKLSIRFDYITSQVVLEHVPPDILNILFHKTKNWLKKDGYAVHTINFIDHFANPGFFQDKTISEFNFLRYSDKYWSFWAGNSIAYTNRLSHLYYLELCEQHRFAHFDFVGENYRKRVELNVDFIHADILKKYNTIPLKSDLVKYQRGTLLLKA
jgi:hypothetical protein